MIVLEDVILEFLDLLVTEGTAMMPAHCFLNAGAAVHMAASGYVGIVDGVQADRALELRLQLVGLYFYRCLDLRMQGLGLRLAVHWLVLYDHLINYESCITGDIIIIVNIPFIRYKNVRSPHGPENPSHKH